MAPAAGIFQLQKELESFWARSDVSSTSAGNKHEEAPGSFSEKKTSRESMSASPPSVLGVEKVSPRSTGKLCGVAASPSSGRCGRASKRMPGRSGAAKATAEQAQIDHDLEDGEEVEQEEQGHSAPQKVTEEKDEKAGGYSCSKRKQEQQPESEPDTAAYSPPRRRRRRRQRHARSTSRMQRRSCSRARKRSSSRGRSRSQSVKFGGLRLPKRSDWKGTREEMGLPPPRSSGSPRRKTRSRSSSSPSSSRSSRSRSHKERRVARLAPKRSRSRSPKECSRSPLRRWHPAKVTASKQNSRWDMKTAEAEALQVLPLPPSSNFGYCPKKRRECYFGNLAVGQVDETVLRQTLNRLFKSLPSFLETYPDVRDVVRAIYFPEQGQGMFAFVEFFDEVLAATAVQLTGFELCGRELKVGRPTKVPPGMPQPSPLDVKPLRDAGHLPEEAEGVGKVSSITNHMREVYFGNLSSGEVDEELMLELVTPACLELPEYDASLGPPVTKVNIAANGKYGFLQFQNAEMATRVIAIFDDTELLGRNLFVSRPRKYSLTVQQAERGDQTVFPLPPPPPVPDSHRRRPRSPDMLPSALPQLLEIAASELAAETNKPAAEKKMPS